MGRSSASINHQILADMNAPPNDLPIYRVLTGVDDAAFCRRVSEAIGLGYRVYGSPAVTFNGHAVIVAQALVWPGAECVSGSACAGNENPPRLVLS